MSEINERLEEANSIVEQVHSLSARFARTFRLPRYPDGRHESDSEHSHTLAMLCIELASRFHPELDLGRLALLATVHDLAEAGMENGDIPTLFIDAPGLKTKKESEVNGISLLRLRYPQASCLLDLVQGYEPEGGGDDHCGFVFVVDKIAPSLTHSRNGYSDLISLGITTSVGLMQSVAATQARIEPFRERFPLLVALRDYRLKLDGEALDAMSASYLVQSVGDSV